MAAQAGLSLSDVAEGGALDAEDSGLIALRDLGRALVNYFFMSCRTLAIHSAANAAVKEPLRRLHEVLSDLHGHVQRTHFIAVEGQLYLNDLRIKMEASAYGNAQFVVDLLSKHGIGGITFGRPLAEDDLRALILLLLQHKPPKDGGGEATLESVKAALEKADIPDVEFDRPYFYKAAGSDGGGGGVAIEDTPEIEQAALSYAKGVLAVKDYFRAVEAAETANPLRIRKIVQDLVDVAEASPDQFLRLHTIQGIEDPYYNHCVNVSSLAVAIGRELKLSRIELADLGACAMFHDLGYAALERDANGNELSEAERQQEHPVAGFRALLRQGEYGPGLMRRLLVTLEHHMHWKRPGGWPNLGRKRTSVFTRVIQVADYYDALVTPIGEQAGLLPVKALERIVAASGTVFDPLMVKAIVRVVGRYPYGSLVKLNTGEIGVVTSGGREAEAFLKPRVMIVRDGEGKSCDPFEADLLSAELPRRRITGVLNPFDEGITPHAVLFEELKPDAKPEVAAAEEPDTAADSEKTLDGPPKSKSSAEIIQDLMDRVDDNWEDDGPGDLARQSRDLWGDVLTGSIPTLLDPDALPASGSEAGADSGEHPPLAPVLDETGPVPTLEDRTTASGVEPVGGPDPNSGWTPEPPADDHHVGADTDRHGPVPEPQWIGGSWPGGDAFLPPVGEDYDGHLGHVTELSAPVDDHHWDGPTQGKMDAVPNPGRVPSGRSVAPGTTSPKVDPPPAPARHESRDSTRTRGLKTSVEPTPVPPTPVGAPSPAVEAAAPAAATPPPEDGKAFARKLAAAYARGGEAAVQELMRTSFGEGMKAVDPGTPNK